MSKPEEKNTPGNNQSDPGLGEQNTADQKVPPDNSNGQKGKPEIATIEEHKKNMNISAPVFAAVIQSKGWASGKRVPVAVFEKAVKDFLGAPMDGVREDFPAIEEHQKKLKIDAPVLEAVMKAKGWRINSKLSEEVLTEAVKEYLDAHKEGGN